MAYFFLFCREAGKKESENNRSLSFFFSDRRYDLILIHLALITHQRLRFFKVSCKQVEEQQCDQ